MSNKATMPQAIKDKWVAALRSGEYKQGQFKLFNTHSESYCCLGVLEHCVSGMVEARYTPSEEWLKNHDIAFGLDANGYPSTGPYFHVTHKGKKGIIGVWKLNDEYEFTFNEIADIIEEQVEGV